MLHCYHLCSTQMQSCDVVDACSQQLRVWGARAHAGLGRLFSMGRLGPLQLAAAAVSLVRAGTEARRLAQHVRGRSLCAKRRPFRYYGQVQTYSRPSGSSEVQRTER